MTEEFKDMGFSLMETVCINELEIHGRVEAILYNVDGVSYKIRYWYEGILHAEWMYACELSTVKKSKKIISSTQ